jgi:hypothetical protein
MRLNTAFIELARAKVYEPGGPTAVILKDVVAYRRAHDLDTKFPAQGNPLAHDDATLEYEFRKLAVVFEMIRRDGPSLDQRRETVDVLKECFPANEVDEIVREYELLKPERPANSPKTETGQAWMM